MDNQKCWICGGDPLTREHKIKKTDLRSTFGKISQQKPVFMHTAKKTNKKINSYDSKQLKFYPSICEKCNSKISQPFDNAWTSMSDFIAKKKKTEKIELIDLEDIFHGSVSRSMLNVHLFFVKWFGCLIKENSIPIELDSFSGSIMNLTEHPFIYLAINVIKLAYGLV